MRTVSIVAASLAVIGVSACRTKEADGDLARDLARASSSEGIVLAPAGPAQTVVSAEEQLTPRHTYVARSQRSAPHRVPHADRTSPRLAALPVLVSPQPVDLPVAVTPRPRPVEVSYPTHGSSIPDRDGGIGSDGGGGGSSTGSVIGSVFGAILRGGVADGDHCDPRGAGRRGTGNISINTQMPPIHGTF